MENKRDATCDCDMRCGTRPVQLKLANRGEKKSPGADSVYNLASRCHIIYTVSAGGLKFGFRVQGIAPIDPAADLRKPQYRSVYIYI